MITKEDIITCESYKGLCDYVYAGEESPVEGLVHVNMEEIPLFFSAISKFPERKYVVVSSCSDFGLCYQEQNPVWADMPKWARMMVNPQLGYKRAVLEPRCRLDKCNPEHKYSSKCYSYTAFTFPEIPKNILHWFTTNSKILDDERISIIPFGVAPNGADDIIEVAAEGNSKEERSYINWVNYTVDRLEIQEHYKILNPPDMTIVTEAKPYKEYLRDLSRHALVISPEGNGVDCYRTLETIYVGSVPVVQYNAVNIALSDLPMALTLTMFGLQTRQMMNAYHEIKRQGRSLDKAKLSYWQTQFDNKRKELL